MLRSNFQDLIFYSHELFLLLQRKIRYFQMKVVTTVHALREALREVDPKGVGFVPTMGALHAGHRSLVERARRECETVVVSVFVNPTQFNDKNDLTRYPRTPEADAALLEAAGADLVTVKFDNGQFLSFAYQQSMGMVAAIITWIL